SLVMGELLFREIVRAGWSARIGRRDDPRPRLFGGLGSWAAARPCPGRRAAPRRRAGAVHRAAGTGRRRPAAGPRARLGPRPPHRQTPGRPDRRGRRSEERRGGKEWWGGGARTVERRRKSQLGTVIA